MRLDRRELITSEKHYDSLWALSWCPDQSLLTGSIDESVVLWNEDASGTLRKTHTFLAQGLGVVCLAVHRDGRYAAASCLDGGIRVWDIQDPSKKLHRFQPAAAENWGIDFAPVSDKVIFATAGGLTSTISIYDLGEETKKKMTLKLPLVRDDQSRNQRNSFVLAAMFSPDGRRIVGTCDNGLVVVFDVETGNTLYKLTDNITPVRTAVFSPDSETLVTGSDSATLTFYDSNSGALIASIDSRSVKEAGPYEDPSMFLDLSFHPDGTHLISSTGHGKIYLWDVASKERIQTLNDHSNGVWCARFSLDGTKVASACDDGALGLFTVMST